MLFERFLRARKADDTQQESLSTSINKINELTTEYNKIVSDEFKLPKITDENFSAVLKQLNGLLQDIFLGRAAIKIRTLLVEEVEEDLFFYLKGKIETAERGGNAESMIRFAKLFKSAKTSVFRSVDDILNGINENRPAVQEFIGNIKSIKGTDIFSRNALIFYSLKFGEQLAAIEGHNMPESYKAETIKDEQVQLILFKYYVNALQNQRFDPAAFYESVKTANLRIGENNRITASEMALEPIDIETANSSIESNFIFQLLVESLGKMNKSHHYQNTRKYFEKLDNHFLAAFNSKIQNLRFNAEGLNKEDHVPCR